MLNEFPETIVRPLRYRKQLAAYAPVIAAIALLVSGSAPAQNTAKMVVVGGKDVTGQVLKRLGLPNQDYCWQQCLDEPRCTGTRWGVISGVTAGQCQLLTGDLTFHSPKRIRTEDGKDIQVTASTKK